MFLFCSSVKTKVKIARERRLPLASSHPRFQMLRHPERVGDDGESGIHGADGSRCIDLWFQHLAIVVADMGAAYAQLRAAGDFIAITEGGPQTLPPASGSVAAFKFRDPEGHPLELLWFPAAGAPPRWRNPAQGALLLGIDHSAITVAETAASVAFYEERLGLSVTARSLNRGVEQERLDDTPGAVVEVTALSPTDPTSPHLELLCYRAPPGGRPMPAGGRDSDIAATRLIFAGGRGALRDPDGHRLAFTPAG